MQSSRRAFLVGSTALLAGCGGSLRRFPFDRGEGGTAVPGLEVVFFGVACFVLRWRGTAVLVDPFFTNVPLLQVAFGRAASDSARVDPHLPLLQDVQTVLVGHAHYDHVLDLPYVAPHVKSGTQVFGSRTLAHTLAPLALPLTFHAVNEHCASPTQAGRWYPASNGRIRVMPIASGHPNNYAFIHMWPQRLTADRRRPPTRAGHFQEGETLAFLVDFLAEDGKTIVHRVYVQTSSRGYPDGFFPPQIVADRGVDVALLGMDCANIASGGRRSVLDLLSPKTVLFCHWENFFRTKDRPPREVVKVNLPRLRRWAEEDGRSDYRFPAWNSRFLFPDSTGSLAHFEPSAIPG